MSDGSSIEWTDASWSPIRARGGLGKWFCERVSPGCDHCYASAFNKRMGGLPYPKVDLRYAESMVQAGNIYLDEDALRKPLSWRKPRRVFLSSMTDVFGEWVPDKWLDQVFAVMAEARQHTFQVLTKRPRRMRDYLEAPATPERIEQHVSLLAQTRGLPCADELEQWPLPNVWFGVSVESDAYTWRAKVLSEIPAAVRFVSAEPLLGPLPSLDLERRERCPNGCANVLEDGKPMYCNVNGCDMESPGATDRAAIDWLIVGGESGGPAERRLVEKCPPGHCGLTGQYDDHSGHFGACCACKGQGWRPKGLLKLGRPDSERPVQWVRDLRDRATAAGVAFFLKAWGGPTFKSAGRLLDGREWNEMPHAQ